MALSGALDVSDGLAAKGFGQYAGLFRSHEIGLPLLQICAEETDGGVWAEVFGALPQIGHEDREPLMEAMPAIRAPFPARSAV
jgi:hypothetical protein